MATAGLAGCAGEGTGDIDLRTADHTVEQYRNDAELRDATLNACRTTTDAAMKQMHQEYAACDRAFQAHRQLMDQAMDDAVRASNQRELDRRAKKPKE